MPETGPNVPVGLSTGRRAVLELAPRHAGRPGTTRLLIVPSGPCLARAVPGRAGPVGQLYTRRIWRSTGTRRSQHGSGQPVVLRRGVGRLCSEVANLALPSAFSAAPLLSPHSAARRRPASPLARSHLAGLGLAGMTSSLAQRPASAVASPCLSRLAVGGGARGIAAGVRCRAQAAEMDAHYMRRCVELARKAAGHTSPNPMVGCVLIRVGCRLETLNKTSLFVRTT